MNRSTYKNANFVSYYYTKNSICQGGRFADDFYSIRREYEKFAANSLMMYDNSPAQLSAYSATADWKMT